MTIVLAARHSTRAKRRLSLGERDLRYSLRTGYLKTARARARQCAVTAKGLFSQLKSGALEHMAFEELKAYVEDVFRTLLDEHDLAKAVDLKDYPKNLEYERGRSPRPSRIQRDVYDTLQGLDAPRKAGSS